MRWRVTRTWRVHIVCFWRMMRRVVRGAGGRMRVELRARDVRRRRTVLIWPVQVAIQRCRLWLTGVLFEWLLMLLGLRPRPMPQSWRLGMYSRCGALDQLIRDNACAVADATCTRDCV